ncbi:OsmC family protein [Brevibacillus daliensis]|uniref:OsmC family protein n=1 Tax=Brevibacillus daliensis TaxID=2892995 RepID=UPI001E607F28|nr:OsmC family protein [Brevibacillus daliensis]
MEFTRLHNTLQTIMPFGKLTISRNREEGYKPIDLLVASIAGCSQIVFTRILEKKRISFTTLRLQVDFEQSSGGSNPLTKVSLAYELSGENLDQDKLEKALRLVPSNCTIMQSLNPSIEVIETVTIK